jgi:hypothetical protein
LCRAEFKIATVKGPLRENYEVKKVLKKSIAGLMAILMIASVSTISAFALDPGTYAPPNDEDGKIFFNLVDDEYVYAGDQAQHSVESAVYEDGYATLTFYTDVVAIGGYHYYGVITTSPYTIGAPVFVYDDDGNIVGVRQTLDYYQGLETDYNDISISVAFTGIEAGAPPAPIPPHSFTYAVNVDPA